MIIQIQIKNANKERSHVFYSTSLARAPRIEIVLFLLIKGNSIIAAAAVRIMTISCIVLTREPLRKAEELTD